MATRTAKLMPHLWHNPEHIIYVPAFIFYYFAIMKLYAVVTPHKTAWGTRAGVGDPTAATAAAAAATNDNTGYSNVPATPSRGSTLEAPTTPMHTQTPTFSGQLQMDYEKSAVYGGGMV